MLFGCILLCFCCKSTAPIQNTQRIKEDKEINLYAFIGKKISVKEFKLESSETMEIDSVTGDTTEYINIVMDRAFKAKYKVIQNVFNKLPSDTVEFIAFDHYGQPKFKKHRYVMLYLSLDEKAGTYYHQKYQFDPVKKIGKNSWSGVNGESLKELFDVKKNGVLKRRGVFE